MVVRPDAPPLTVEEYKNLPETGPRYQLIEGDLYTAQGRRIWWLRFSRRRPGSSIWSIRSGSTRGSGSRNSGSLIPNRAPSPFTDLNKAKWIPWRYCSRTTRSALPCCSGFRSGPLRSFAGRSRQDQPSYPRTWSRRLDGPAAESADGLRLRHPATDGRQTAREEFDIGEHQAADFVEGFLDAAGAMG